MTRPILTSSWDDGAPQDLRLAERLVGGGWCGTFYICRDYDGRPRLTDSEIKLLAQMPGIEIGAHTLTHPDLRRVSTEQLRNEVEGSRVWLEDLIGVEVTAFCYPMGLHDARSARAAAAAGFRLARTTRNGWTRSIFDPFRMPTTAQIYQHSRAVALRHAAKERNVEGLLRFAAMRQWPSSPAGLGRRLLEGRPQDEASLVHFWGHSWELDTHSLWGELDALIAMVAEFDAVSLTNSAAVARIGEVGSVR